MTRMTNARIAGTAFLLYIAIGITSMVVYDQVLAGAEGSAARLAAIAAHAGTVRLAALCNVLTFVCALVLGVTMWSLTRDIDPDLAMISMGCRVTEGVTGVVSAIGMLELVAIAGLATNAASPDAAAAGSYGAMLMKEGSVGVPVSAFCFAIASTIYCGLFLKARSIPAILAWLGIVASVLLLVVLPLQILGFMSDSWFIWMPMLLFEVVFAGWLIFKGVAQTARPVS